MIDFSVRLKELRKSAKLNQRQLAIAIGVAQTAIANYESGLRFPSEEKLIKLAEYFNISIDVLLGRDVFIGAEGLLSHYGCKCQDQDFYVKLADDIIEKLIQMQKGEVVEILAHLPEQGISVEAIYHKIFQYILYKTGWLWETGLIDVGVEHFISQTIEEVMPILMRNAAKKSSNFKKAICLTPYGEEHVIVNHMISDLLELEGFDSYCLGRNVPQNDLMQYVKSVKPNILVLSVTLDRHMVSLKETIEGLRTLQIEIPFKFIVGGNPFKNKVDISVEAVGTSIEDTVRKAKTLTDL